LPLFIVGCAAYPRHTALGNSIANNRSQGIIILCARQRWTIETRGSTSCTLEAMAVGTQTLKELFGLLDVCGILSQSQKGYCQNRQKHIVSL
jgi:hypothetical protein